VKANLSFLCQDGSSDELVAKRSKHAEENDKQVKLLVKHVLSHELRLYFEKVTAAILGDDEAQKKLVFASLAADPGLQQLVPYFAKFISDEVRAFCLFVFAFVLM
jgi:hypothetical protein